MSLSDVLFDTIQTMECYRVEWSENYDGLRDEIEAVKRVMHDMRQFSEAPTPACLGYIQLDRPGDYGPGTRCVDCAQKIWGTLWVALMTDGSVRGPLCDLCAKPE